MLNDTMSFNPNSLPLRYNSGQQDSLQISKTELS